MDPCFVFKYIKLYNQQWLYIKLFCTWTRCAARRPTLTSSFHIRIRNSGLQVSEKNDNSEVKLTLFAADLTCFVSNRTSNDCLRDCLSKFSECSGLKVNQETTELFKLGTRNLAYRRS